MQVLECWNGVFTLVAVSSGDMVDETISLNKKNASGVAQLSKSAIFKYFFSDLAEKFLTMNF